MATIPGCFSDGNAETASGGEDEMVIGAFLFYRKSQTPWLAFRYQNPMVVSLIRSYHPCIGLRALDARSVQ